MNDEWRVKALLALSWVHVLGAAVCIVGGIIRGTLAFAVIAAIVLLGFGWGWFVASKMERAANEAAAKRRELQDAFIKALNSVKRGSL